MITFDNRIPPRGFNNEAFEERGCRPVGVSYADGQHWDDVAFEIPAGCVKVEARLWYQAVIWDYIKFLAEENRSDEWGKRLYDAWDKTGRCPPVSIAETELAIP